MEDRAQKLEDTAPNGDFSRFDIEVMIPELEKIPRGGIYLEIGVNKGRSLWVARKVVKPSVMVSGIDLRENPKIKGTIFMRGDSVEVANTRGNELEINVLLIDGDHSYQGCKRDIDAWLPFMKKNGVIMFHDCDESSPGVVQATNEAFPGKVELFKTIVKNTSMAKVQL